MCAQISEVELRVGAQIDYYGKQPSPGHTAKLLLLCLVYVFLRIARRHATSLSQFYKLLRHNRFNSIPFEIFPLHPTPSTLRECMCVSVCVSVYWFAGGSSSFWSRENDTFYSRRLERKVFEIVEG